MQRARAAILAHGGADAVNSFTRFYLALLGQISYEQCPAVPPEMMLLPKWFPVNLYNGQRLVADDHRAAVDHVGLPAGGRSRAAASASANCSSSSPTIGRRCVARASPKGTGLLSWDRFFRTVDRGSEVAASGTADCRCASGRCKPPSSG